MRGKVEQGEGRPEGLRTEEGGMEEDGLRVAEGVTRKGDVPYVWSV